MTWSLKRVHSGIRSLSDGRIMTEHNLFYYPDAFFANAQLPLSKVAALYFEKLVLLDPVVRAGTPSARTTLPATP